MLQVEAAASVDLLTSMWTAVVRTRPFPPEWEEAIICPIFRKGLESNPENYRPVCLFLHAQNAIDTVILSILNEQFTPAASQFRFHGGIAVTQALLQTEDNAQAGIHHAAVLDLEKLYNKVDWKLLMDFTRKWVDKKRRPIWFSRCCYLCEYARAATLIITRP